MILVLGVACRGRGGTLLLVSGRSVTYDKLA